MSIPSAERSKLLLFDPSDVPLTEDGSLLADVYVELPHNARFIRYVLSGDTLSETHLQKLSKHTSKHLFVLIDELTNDSHASSKHDYLNIQEDKSWSTNSFLYPQAASHELLENNEHGNSRQRHEGFPIEGGMLTLFGQDDSEFLRAPIASVLKGIYDEMSASDIAHIRLEITPISELTDRLVKVIAPEVETLRNYLHAIPQYRTIMHDSAAITTIATLFAIALGHTSRNVFKNLSYACIFMDISLAELSEESWKTYYLDPERLSKEDARRVRSHPERSTDLVQKRFRKLPDVVLQMILGHHELFNGKGFPRGHRSEKLAPLVRALALSVDVFEFMKRAHLRGEPCDLEGAVNHFVNEAAEAHHRRHNLTLCREISEYLSKN
jgi:hypothetical protein